MFEDELAAAEQLSHRGAYREATAARERALAAARTPREQARALILIAHDLPRQGDLQAALRRASEAVALVRQIEGEDSHALLAQALTELCYVYAQFLMGRDALQTGWQALAAARAAREPLLEAWALNRLAVASAAMDQTEQACQDTVQALEIAQSTLSAMTAAGQDVRLLMPQAGSTSASSIASASSASSALSSSSNGDATAGSGLPPTAAAPNPQGQRQSQVRGVIQAQELLLSCLNNLAHFWLQAHAEALRNEDRTAAAEALARAGPYAVRAAELVRHAGNPFLVVVSLSNLVEHLLGNGEITHALALVDEYEAIALREGYGGMALQARAQRALLQLRRDDPARVMQALAGMQALLTHEGPPQLPLRLRRQLSLAMYRVYKARGDYAQALSAHEQLSALERQAARNAMALQTEARLIRQEFEQARARAEHAMQDARRERERAEHAEQEQHKLRRQAAELGRMAHEDALTALNNRRHAEFALPLLLERARQEHQPIALGLLDVDHFKRVNDSFGHGMGDQVLQQVAQLLRRQLRSADLLARVGGEEFMLVFVGVPPPRAQDICERLRQAIAGFSWQDLAPNLSLTVSIGLSAGEPPSRVDLLVETADQALYAAKHNGRDRVQFMAS
ncbi:GGDEF domain-containing protein [Roseateles amylovorans]|uniref:diguanylate cyclase n=1 Tax=Roseateles amylovorans TaxID=2978473 RepID=A0ABY6B4A1_9BURK|nr:GGDEF domain-containing protein [Roseateles amylovorans]UXH79556.1 GGDEF domain-containing protein [Roseateles amylovorans]